MAPDLYEHAWVSDVYHHPDPETDRPKVLNAYGEASLVNGDSQMDECLKRLKLLEQEVADLKEFVHELADGLNVRELRRQRDERRKRER